MGLNETALHNKTRDFIDAMNANPRVQEWMKEEDTYVLENYSDQTDDDGIPAFYTEHQGLDRKAYFRYSAYLSSGLLYCQVFCSLTGHSIEAIAGEPAPSSPTEKGQADGVGAVSQGGHKSLVEAAFGAHGPLGLSAMWDYLNEMPVELRVLRMEVAQHSDSAGKVEAVRYFRSFWDDIAPEWIDEHDEYTEYDPSWTDEQVVVWLDQLEKDERDYMSKDVPKRS